jgi:molybdopterin/thiamine biosynthesis adenylyltransferase
MSFIADYSRQLSLSSMSEEKQSLLIKSRALVFGAGGLGVAAISYLSAAGVGTITVVDFDRIEASNLHRQTIYGATDIGAYKAEVAASYIR